MPLQLGKEKKKGKNLKKIKLSLKNRIKINITDFGCWKSAASKILDFSLYTKKKLVWFLCFNGISTFVGYFNAKAVTIEEQQ